VNNTSDVVIGDNDVILMDLRLKY